MTAGTRWRRVQNEPGSVVVVVRGAGGGCGHTVRPDRLRHACNAAAQPRTFGCGELNRYRSYLSILALPAMRKLGDILTAAFGVTAFTKGSHAAILVS